MKSLTSEEGNSITPTSPKIIIIKLDIKFKPTECLGKARNTYGEP